MAALKSAKPAQTSKSAKPDEELKLEYAFKTNDKGWGRFVSTETGRFVSDSEVQALADKCWRDSQLLAQKASALYAILRTGKEHLSEQAAARDFSKSKKPTAKKEAKTGKKEDQPPTCKKEDDGIPAPDKEDGGECTAGKKDYEL